ncbi:MAG: DNA alkylation repair protein [Clostridia bacterium]|nr:DNA alkylation repair protein [Clostridia bacterium]
MKDEILQKLLSLADNPYKEFSAPLLPTIPRENIIGIRTPILRAYAKELKKKGGYESFLRELPHKYLEENHLHAFLIEALPYQEFAKEIELFLPYIDNWATCDSLRPKNLKNNYDSYLLLIKRWILSDKPYTIRFGIGMLMSYYLDERFDERFLYDVSAIKSDHYYVNMMIAWYFATALAKQYDSTLPYLQNKVLSKWVHNKTIQKAVESYRITNEQKRFLKTLKIK